MKDFCNIAFHIKYETLSVTPDLNTFSTCLQERIIERLKEQRDREEREKSEELDTSKRELKELKEKVSLLQGDLSDREVSVTNYRIQITCRVLCLVLSLFRYTI